MKCKIKERKITSNNNNDKKEIKKGKKGSKQIIFVAIKSILFIGYGCRNFQKLNGI